MMMMVLSFIARIRFASFRIISFRIPSLRFPPVRIPPLRIEYSSRWGCSWCRCRRSRRRPGRRLRSRIRIFTPLPRSGAVNLLDSRSIVIRQILRGVVALVPREHDRVLDGRVAQPQGMAELVHCGAHQICAVIVLLVDQPRLLVVKMSVASDAWPRVEGMC